MCSAALCRAELSVLTCAVHKVCSYAVGIGSVLSLPLNCQNNGHKYSWCPPDSQWVLKLDLLSLNFSGCWVCFTCAAEDSFRCYVDIFELRFGCPGHIKSNSEIHMCIRVCCQWFMPLLSASVSSPASTSYSTVSWNQLLRLLPRVPFHISWGPRLERSWWENRSSKTECLPSLSLSQVCMSEITHKVLEQTMAHRACCAAVLLCERQLGQERNNWTSASNAAKAPAHDVQGDNICQPLQKWFRTMRPLWRQLIPGKLASVKDWQSWVFMKGNLKSRGSWAS